MKKNWFTIDRVRSNIYALAEFNHDEKVVSYLVVGETGAVLFDTGMGHADIRREVRTITTLPISVLLTHAHWDHVGGLQDFSDVSVYDNAFEIELLKGIWPLQLLKDGEHVVAGGFSIQIIHTPGHSPGSTTYFLPDMNVLVVGDTLYPGPLYAHLPESNIPDYAVSLKKLLAIANEETLILPGHNRTHCQYDLLARAARLMSQAAVTARSGKKELRGSGFSILLP